MQGKQRKYQPLLRPDDQPAVWLNKESMDRFRPELRKHYYDSTRYSSYLEQLGVAYPPPMPSSPPPGTLTTVIKQPYTGDKPDETSSTP